MLVLRTNQKIRVAKWLSKFLVAIRRTVGLPPEVQVRRRGISWQLDLREGIDLAIFLGVYERFFEPIARRYVSEGALAVDIGANIGAHTLTMAKLVGPNGHVLAVEPTRFAFAKLRRNLSINPELARRVHVQQVFLNDGKHTEAPEGVHASWPLGKADEEIHPVLMGRRMDTHGASGGSLDSMLDGNALQSIEISHLDFMKIDVDGNELGILRGATETIKQYRPVLLIECEPSLQKDPEKWAEEWIEIMEQLRYEMLDPRDQRVIDLTSDSLINIAPSGASRDLIAIPKERLP